MAQAFRGEVCGTSNMNFVAGSSEIRSRRIAYVTSVSTRILSIQAISSASLILS